jgi:hypothetical protein
MSRKMGMDVNWMNNYGNSMIYGHPQGPTAGRLIAELIEEIVLLGGVMAYGPVVLLVIPEPPWSSR